MDGLGELDQRKRSPREHIWLGNSDSVVLLVFLEAVHQIFKLYAVFIFEKRHQVLNDFDENRLLLLQNVQSWIATELKRVDETCVFVIPHPIVGLNLKSSRDSPSHGLLLDVVVHHIVVNSASSSSLS